MQTMIDVKATCELLREWDDILILTHQKPDGDTLGSSFALMWALEAMGKRTRVESPDGFPERYKFITGDYTPADFLPRRVVTVDVANPELLGSLRHWEDQLDLCIDHHRLNTIRSKYKLLNYEVPAAAQLTCQVIKGLRVPIDRRIANAIFSGLSTDTGCFMYPSVTAETHRMAGEMIEAGADHGLINRLMFDTKSKARMELDKIILNTLEYHFGGLCALMTISREVTERLGIDEAELDGISSIPRRIQGVEAGITLRQNDGSYRISVRTRGRVDCSALCAKFGGGGHKAAGGCTIKGDEQTVKQALLAALEAALREAGCDWN